MEDHAEYKTKKKSLTEVYHELTKKAAKEKITEFIINYDGNIYLCKWKHQKWTDPKKIPIFTE